MFYSFGMDGPAKSFKYDKKSLAPAGAGNHEIGWPSSLVTNIRGASGEGLFANQFVIYLMTTLSF